MKKIGIFALVMLQMFYNITFANSESMFSISLSDINTYYEAWHKYFQDQENKIDILYSQSDDNDVDTRIIIYYNLSHEKENLGISKIPNTTSIYMIFDWLDLSMDFLLCDNQLQGTLDDIVFFTNEQVLHNIGLSTDKIDTGALVWTITIDFDTLLSLFDSEKGFTVKAIHGGKTEYIEIRNSDQPYLYDMVYLLYGALMYSDSTSEHFKDEALLPLDYVSYEIAPTSAPLISGYSFQKDYDAIEQKAKSVFYVDVYDAEMNWIGRASGFVAFDEHLFVTNQHVIDGATYLKIWDEDDNGYLLDRVAISDKKSDIAILLFPEGKKFKSLELQLNADLKRGQNVTTIGSPKGYQNTVAFGNISSLKTSDGEKLIQFTAPISAGSSGGALFDDTGKVIGITSSGVAEGENIGFAIPIDTLKMLYDQWNKKISIILGTEMAWDTKEWESTSGENLVVKSTSKPLLTPQVTDEPATKKNISQKVNIGDIIDTSFVEISIDEVHNYEQLSFSSEETGKDIKSVASQNDNVRYFAIKGTMKNLTNETLYFNGKLYCNVFIDGKKYKGILTYSSAALLRADEKQSFYLWTKVPKDIAYRYFYCLFQFGFNEKFKNSTSSNNVIDECDYKYEILFDKENPLTELAVLTPRISSLNDVTGNVTASVPQLNNMWKLPKIRIKNACNPNVRNKPSADGEIIGRAKSNQVYDLLAVTQNWYEIRLENGKEGWIANGMATIIDK